jgi:7-keto-8-aminopelargonate synthetase-like enzyme
MTMIDEAHATGVIGKKGRGAEEYFGVGNNCCLEGQIDIVMGTLSKALGSLGGFVAGNHELIDYLRNKARSFIYTTALPPAACAAALAALEIIETDPEPLRNLRRACRQAGINLRFLKSETPIFPIIIGDADKTMEISAELFNRGIFVSGIRPPTVPKNQCRLRISVTAAHSREDLACLVSSLRELIPVAEKLI